MSNPGSIVVCQSGFEDLLVREVRELGQEASGSGPGWASFEGPAEVLRSAAFAHGVLESAGKASGDRVNVLAQQVLEYFLASLQGERIEGPWPCSFSGPHEVTGLGRRVASVESAFHELLKKRLGRVAKLASGARPRLGSARGLFVWFTDFGEARVSRSATFCGPCRMADDDLAPSRSYLKVEEAYGLLGREPAAGETVCDLGAAPGGWSYSAAKRGARVVAVDNGPLKGGALGHPLIDHREADAFGFSPGKDAVYDWLFADLVEDPHKVLQLIARPWVSGRWCRRFVINLKFGRVDPVALLGDLRSSGSPFASGCQGLRTTHLFHDREEFTVTGEVVP